MLFGTFGPKTAKKCRFLDPVYGTQEGKRWKDSISKSQSGTAHLVPTESHGHSGPRIGHARTRVMEPLTGSGKDSLRSLFPPALRLWAKGRSIVKSTFPSQGPRGALSQVAEQREGYYTGQGSPSLTG